MTSGSSRPFLTAALVLALSGCAGTAPEAAPATSPAGPPETSAASTAAAEGRRIEVSVAGGQVSGDTGRVPVAAGERVTLVVTGDVADEIHLHGYDLTAPLQPGTPAELSFDATVPGVFEAELHEAGTVLVTLQVG